MEQLGLASVMANLNNYSINVRYAEVQPSPCNSHPEPAAEPRLSANCETQKLQLPQNEKLDGRSVDEFGIIA